VDTGRPPPHAPHPSGWRRRTGQLLLVDDEQHILDWLGPLLREDLVVVTSPSAAGALDVLRAGMRFDVILCDVAMPTMTGVDLHEALAREMPEYAGRMVFMTGPIDDPSLRARLEQLPNPRVDKPIDVEALRVLMTELLRRRSVAPANSR
jgi:CheY-like chemotaxis protein